MSTTEGLAERDALVALNRAATTARLLSGAVHDINNALQVIAGSVELLEQQPALSPAVLKSLDRIKRQGERAAGTLAELQRFTKAPLDARERFSLRESVELAVSLRRYATSRAGLAIDLAIDDGGAHLVSGNPGQVQQALINLLVNAEEAMANRPGVIAVALRSDAARVGVEVTDAGPGMSEVDVGRIGRPFSSSRRRRENAGLGLWSVKTIVESFDGSLEVVSSPTGTSVSVWFPRG